MLLLFLKLLIDCFNKLCHNNISFNTCNKSAGLSVIRIGNKSSTEGGIS